MRKNIIIDCKTDVSKVKQFFLLKNLFKKEYEKTILVNDEEIQIVEIPLSNKNNEKIIKKIVDIINKEEKVNIIFSENVRKNEELYDILKNNIKTYEGENVLNFFIKDIYKKYLLINNKKDYEAELVIFSDNPEKTYWFLKKICKNLKNAYIVSENYNGFDNLIKKIYDEYGFYIYFTQKSGNIFLKDRIYINLAEKTDFFIYEAEKENVIILNLSGKIILSKSMLNTFVFSSSEQFKEFSSYFKYFDQECVEFLVKALKKSVKKEKIKELINDENVKLKKICLKNC